MTRTFWTLADPARHQKELTLNALRIHFVLFTLLAALAPHAASAGNAAPIWQVEYTSSGIPPIPISGQPKLAAGPSGIYAYGFAEPGALGSMVVKLDPTTANTEWSAVAPLETERGAAFDRVLVLQNGALVLAGSVSQLSNGGDVEWSIPRSFNYFSGYGTAAASLIDVGLIQLANSSRLNGGGSEFKVSVISPTSGETIDKVILPFSGNDDDCRLIDLVNISLSTSYVASNCVDGMLLKLELFPLSVQWTLPPSTPAIDHLTSMRADASGVYLTGSRNGGSFLSKLATSDASALWTIDRPAGSIEAVRIDIDGNPVVSGNSASSLGNVEKFDAATGASIWTHVSAGKINALFVGANALVVAGADRLSPAEFDTRGFVERLDPVTGASQWRSVLTSPDGGSSNATSVVQQGDRIVVAGAACALPVYESSKCTVAFWRSAASSSAAAESAQSPAQVRVATSGVVRVGNDDSVYVAVTERFGSNAQLRVTRQRKSDGVQVWQTILPIDVDADSWRGVDRYELRLGGDGNPLILLASDPSDFIGASDARVIKLDSANGATLWSRNLVDPSIGKSDSAAAGIASDTSGNVFVPAHERYVDLIDPSIVTRKRVVHKLSSSTGASEWQVEFDPRDDLPFYSIPSGYVAGNDYLIFESPLPTPQIAWTGINGATGGVAWINPALPSGNPVVIDSEKVVIAAGGSALNVIRFSPSSGVAAWHTEYEGFLDQNFSASSGLEADGVVYVGGSRRTVDFSIGYLVSRSIILALQASDGTLSWVNSFDDIPGAVGAVTLRFVTDDLLYASRTTVTPSATPGGNLGVGAELSSFSRTFGNRIGSQMMSRFSRHSHLGVEFNYALTQTVDNTYFSIGERQPAGSPNTFSLASRELPSVEPLGYLVVSLSASVEGVGANLRYSYTFTTENQGDLIAEQVFALLSLPSESRSTTVSCTLDGTPCEATTTATSIEARIDLPSGSLLVLQGSFEVSPGDGTVELLATAFAPLDFVENDLSNNVRTFFFKDRIFGNGFD